MRDEFDGFKRSQGEEKIRGKDLKSATDRSMIINKSIQEIERLSGFILKELPDEIGAGDLVHGESAVDVAIRLLEEWKLYRYDIARVKNKGVNPDFTTD